LADRVYGYDSNHRFFLHVFPRQRETLVVGHLDRNRFYFLLVAFRETA